MFTHIPYRIFQLSCRLVCILFLITITTGCVASGDLVIQAQESFVEQDQNPTGLVQSNQQVLASPQVVEQSNASFCPILQVPFILDFDVRQTPLTDEPAPRISFHDPTFGTCLARLTDRRSDLSSDDSSSGFHYQAASIQAFNADGSQILVRSSANHFYLYASDTLEPVEHLPLDGNIEIRWDPISPIRLYYLRDTILFRYSVDSGQIQKVFDFTEAFPNQRINRVWASTIGNPSADGRYWAFYTQGTNGQALTVLVYDLFEERMVSHIEFTQPAILSGITLSPSGDYVIIRHQQNCADDSKRVADDYCGLMIFDRELTSVRYRTPAVDSLDTALNEAGQDVLVFHDLSLNSITMLNLVTGERSALWLVDASQGSVILHISGRSIDLPGWALVSSFNSGPVQEANWIDNLIFAIELKPDGRLVRLAHTHNTLPLESETGSWAEPFANPNQDLTRVIFTSNWGQASVNEYELYMLGLPENWVSLIP